MEKATHEFNEENIKYLRKLIGDEEVDSYFLVLNSSSDKAIIDT